MRLRGRGASARRSRAVAQPATAGLAALPPRASGSSAPKGLTGLFTWKLVMNLMNAYMQDSSEFECIYAAYCYEVNQQAKLEERCQRAMKDKSQCLVDLLVLLHPQLDKPKQVKPPSRRWMRLLGSCLESPSEF